MRQPNGRRTAVVACLTMLGAATAGEWLRPTVKVSDQHPGFKLEQLFPRQFAGWQVDDSMPVIVPPPDQQALLDKIYNQTLTRTYVDKAGRRIMLSVAYGGDQSDGLTVHIPDVCYVGQGFRMVSASNDSLPVPGGALPLRNLMMILGSRHEPVTYWTLMGDTPTISHTQRRLVNLRYGFQRLIPEGMLVRVSSINPNMPDALVLHRQFITQLVDALPPADRLRVIGRPLEPSQAAG